MSFDGRVHGGAVRIFRFLLGLSILGGGGYLAYRRFGPFVSSVDRIPDSVRERMRGVTWREGCPVGLDELSMVKITYRNNLGLNSVGKVIVATDSADSLVNAFRELHGRGFRIDKVNPVLKYGGNDAASMRANNTSAFNCRKVSGSSSWSEHSKGTAIDINPLVNPYVSAGGSVQPVEGARYADRSIRVKGSITPEIAEVFARNGWKWGGDWKGAKDYQHFSISGR